MLDTPEAQREHIYDDRIALDLLHEIYHRHPGALAFLLPHSCAVAEYATPIALACNADVLFVRRAALLHDIGIIKTHAPSIGCHGTEHYITHGIAGKEILEARGFLKEALVAERHIGTGLTAQHIEETLLPLPCRDMFPISLEECIISYADLFFSKTPAYLSTAKPIALVEEEIRKHGAPAYECFTQWHKMFSRE